MSEGLKPCPFCGSADIVLDHQQEIRFSILCKSCWLSVRSGTFANRSDAIAAWNRRASGWVPVSERLPSDQQKVLFCNKAKYPEVFKGVFLLTEDIVFAPAFVDDHGTSWSVDDNGAVDSWMPLPDLPVEKV